MIFRSKTLPLSQGNINVMLLEYYSLNFIWQLAFLLCHYFIHFDIIISVTLIKSFFVAIYYSKCIKPYRQLISLSYFSCLCAIIWLLSTLYVRHDNTHILYVHFHLNYVQKFTITFCSMQAKHFRLLFVFRMVSLDPYTRSEKSFKIVH